MTRTRNALPILPRRRVRAPRPVRLLEVLDGLFDLPPVIDRGTAQLSLGI